MLCSSELQQFVKILEAMSTEVCRSITAAVEGGGGAGAGEGGGAELEGMLQHICTAAGDGLSLELSLQVRQQHSQELDSQLRLCDSRCT